MKNVDEKFSELSGNQLLNNFGRLTGLLSLINSLFIKWSSFARFNEKTWEYKGNIVYEFCQD